MLVWGFHDRRGPSLHQIHELLEIQVPRIAWQSKNQVTSILSKHISDFFWLHTHSPKANRIRVIFNTRAPVCSSSRCMAWAQDSAFIVQTMILVAGFLWHVRVFRDLGDIVYMYSDQLDQLINLAADHFHGHKLPLQLFHNPQSPKAGSLLITLHGQSLCWPLA